MAAPEQTRNRRDGSEPAERGTIGKQTYAAVRAQIKQGKKATQAFAIVAEQTGRSAATVATAYYRIAREDPNSGVRTRPRKRRAEPRASSKATTVTTVGLIKDVQAALDKLTRHVQRQEAELADLRRNAQRYEDIQRILGRSG
jgi:hypothetical protein